MSSTALAVHAHFYQPPRENPWTEEVPREPSAAPFHDWNTRIAAESYRPNAYARIFDGQGRVLSIVNNYEELSFNVGPTLISWLERHEPGVYDRIREAQTTAGGAIAQAWNHMILPLASERDVRTQIRWGLADFRHRFGAEAPGMWLPETAVNDAVMAALAEEGVGFTILAPYQVDLIRPLIGAASRGPAAMLNRAWQPTREDGGGGDARPLDTRVPYRWLHPAGDGRGVDLVVYNGGLSHALAFEALTSEALVDRVVGAGGRRGGLVAVALDGETFGHHHKWADRALAYALTAESPRRGVEVTNLATWLRRNRPVYEAQVRESAWSCAHGVGRWATDCGCSTGGAPDTDQRWRAPLRAALDSLRDVGVEAFERRGPALFAGGDPWAARDAYVEVLIGATTREEFATRHVVGDPVEAFTLLEAQRNAMLMYTSCGWFFHDLAGLETVQVLRYAARVVDLLVEVGEPSPEAAVLEVLGDAHSFEEGDGRRVWAVHVSPARVDASRVAAHIVLGGLFGLEDVAAGGTLGGFEVEELGGGQATRPTGVGLVWRRVRLTQQRTGRAEELVAVGLRTGELEAFGAVRPATWPADALALDGLRRGIEDGLSDDALVARLAAGFLTAPGMAGGSGVSPGMAGRSFDVSALLPEGAEALLEQAASALADNLASAAEPFLVAAHWAGLAGRQLMPSDGADTVMSGDTPRPPAAELPLALRGPAEAALAHKLERLLGAGELTAAVALARRARLVGLPVFASPAGAGPRQAVGANVFRAVRRAIDEPGDDGPHAALSALELAAELGVEPDVEEAQELVYEAVRAGGRADLAELASRLGLSPELFDAPEATARTA